jgi:hypothetical protein
MMDDDDVEVEDADFGMFAKEAKYGETSNMVEVD